MSKNKKQRRTEAGRERSKMEQKESSDVKINPGWRQGKKRILGNRKGERETEWKEKAIKCEVEIERERGLEKSSRKMGDGGGILKEEEREKRTSNDT